MATNKVWLITGAGRGLGVDIVKAALAGGHKVVATGRNTGASLQVQMRLAPQTKWPQRFGSRLTLTVSCHLPSHTTMRHEAGLMTPWLVINLP